MLIDLKKAIKDYNMRIKGVLHIGAHFGQEKYDKAIYFEPCKDTFNVLRQRVDECYNVALGNRTGKATMFTETANRGQSNSILKPKLHTKQYPHIKFKGTEQVDMIRLDDFPFDRSQYNMINIDVQGYELEVFKGAVETLETIDYIISEVNRAELYEGCAQIEDLDSFLSKHGFRLTYQIWTGGTWGDALWIK